MKKIKISLLSTFFIPLFLFSQALFNGQSNLDQLKQYAKNQFIHNNVFNTMMIDLDSGCYIVSYGIVSNDNSMSKKQRMSHIYARRNLSNFLNGTTIASHKVWKENELISDSKMLYNDSYLSEMSESTKGFITNLKPLDNFIHNGEYIEIMYYQYKCP